MTKVIRGPAIEFDGIDWEAPRDASFRIITDYFLPRDEHVTRLDVLVNGEQLSLALAGNPDACDPDFNRGPIRNCTDLILPKHLAQRHWATLSKVNARQLAQGLRGMADAIEKVL